MHFLGNYARLQNDLLRDSSVDYFNNEEYGNAPQELQDEGLSADDGDLGEREDPPHDATYDATTGPQGDETSQFDFDFNYSFSPGPEPGRLRASQVFMVGPDSEPEEEQDGEGEYEDNYVWFHPDIESEGEDTDEDEIGGMPLEDPRLMQGDGGHQLEIERQAHAIGMYRIPCHLLSAPMRSQDQGFLQRLKGTVSRRSRLK